MVSRRQHIEGARGELHMHNPSRAHTEVLDCTATQVGAAEKGARRRGRSAKESGFVLAQCLQEHSSARLAIVQGRNTSGRSNATMLLDGGMPGSAEGSVALRRSSATMLHDEAMQGTSSQIADAWRPCPQLGSSVVTIPSSTLLPACPFVVGASVQNAERPRCSRAAQIALRAVAGGSVTTSLARLEWPHLAIFEGCFLAVTYNGVPCPPRSSVSLLERGGLEKQGACFRG